MNILIGYVYWIILTLIIGLFLSLTNKLNNKRRELELQNRVLKMFNKKLSKEKEMYKNSVEQLMSLYKISEAFTAQDNLDMVIHTFLDYGIKLIKANTAIFILPYFVTRKNYIISTDENLEIEEEVFLYEINGLWDNPNYKELPFKIKFNDKDFQAVLVESPGKIFGLLAVEAEKLFIKDNENFYQQLIFMGELIGIVLERFRLEEIHEELLVLSERNRIGNEIHDSVSQRLFSIVCGVYTLAYNLESCSYDQMRQQFDIMGKSANEAVKELRAAIYTLSSKKRGEECFFSTIKEYLKEVAALNGVVVDTYFCGDAETLSYSLKRAIYRIICEASGNSVRHGKCKRLRIELSIKDGIIELSIIDDGRGFDLAEINKASRGGLGLSNVRQLVKSFKGSIHIGSEINNGTNIVISIPCKFN